MELKGKEHYEGLIEITKADQDIVPLFIKTLDGDLKIISSFSKDFDDISEGCKLVYLGKLLKVDKEIKEAQL